MDNHVTLPEQCDRYLSCVCGSVRGLNGCSIETARERCCRADGAEICDYSIGKVKASEITGVPCEVACDLPSESAMVTALVQLSGATRLVLAGREIHLAANEICLIRGKQPVGLYAEIEYHMVTVSIDEGDLAVVFPHWKLSLTHPISACSGAPAVFVDVAKSLQRWQVLLSSSGGEGIADSIVQMLGAIACSASPINTACSGRSQFHLDRIKSYIRMHLAEPDLDVERIANAIHLSPRQIQRLFKAEGMSLMQWVWNQRLQCCYRELRQPSSMMRPIGEVAFSWGFSDPAHFSRVFRKHFGMSPSQARIHN